MKRAAAFLLAVTLSAAAQAGFHMGLGGAAAKKSAALFGEAAEKKTADSVGDNVARLLPSCGPAPFTVLPTDLSKMGGLVPLGNLNPPGHTFPTDHIYFYGLRTSTSNPGSPTVEAPLLAPGDITVSEVVSADYLNATPPVTDYSIYFYACRELKAYFFHVRSLDASFQAKLGGGVDDGCWTYSTGGASIRRCSQRVNVPVRAGETLGTVNGPGSSAFDFGAYDHGKPPLAFASPSRHYAEQLYTVCPVDYFETGLKAQLEARFGRYDGGVIRTAPPVCGTIMFDSPSTAQGNWYKIGAPDSPEDPHLALVRNNYRPDWGAFSSGTSVPGLSAPYYFVPAASGLTQRDFAHITADGQIYCYDSFLDPLGQSITNIFTILVHMPTPTTLRIERQATTSCSAGPWAFTSGAVDFQR